MKARYLIILLAVCALFASCSKPCNVVWIEGDKDPETGKTVHTMEINNPPAGTDWTLWFCQFRTPVKMLEGSHARIDHVSGTFYRVVPEVDTEGQKMILRYEARALVNQCRAPEGFFLQKKGKKPVRADVSYVYLPAEKFVSFEYEPVETQVYDMIPRLKDVKCTDEGTTDLAVCQKGDAVHVDGKPQGWYRITLDGNVRVEAADEDGAYYAEVTLENLRRSASGQPVRNMVIEDYPDFQHRGLMLDVSRNFTDKAGLLCLIDLMAHYKANVLHLHFGDDEGWRVEIDDLPELTSYGAFRAVPVLNEDGTISEPDALMQTYGGSLDRNDKTSANGYYSHADFVEILKYAYERRIVVVPEFDTPGHSRAAIKSMEVRAARTGDRTFLLSEPEDTSAYVSVQDYTDNAINVALESTYAFVEKVFDSLIAMYEEAGVPLVAIHVGGDEVPEGAWLGSPSCVALMQEKGMTDVEQLKDYYISRVLDIAQRKGVKIAGWQELAQNLSPETFARLKEQMAFANMWSVSRGKDTLPYEFANDGVDVVLSNAPNFYFDLAYNPGKLERGHSWSGFVDERRSFSFLPYNIYNSVRWDDHSNIKDISNASEGKTALAPGAEMHIKGVQGQLWTETIRCFDHVTYYIFPKAMGLFERGWNARPVWENTTVSDDPAFMKDFDHFFSIIKDKEYPYYDEMGISYHRH